MRKERRRFRFGGGSCFRTRNCSQRLEGPRHDCLYLIGRSGLIASARKCARQCSKHHKDQSDTRINTSIHFLSSNNLGSTVFNGKTIFSTTKVTKDNRQNESFSFSFVYFVPFVVRLFPVD